MLLCYFFCDENLLAEGTQKGGKAPSSKKGNLHETQVWEREKSTWNVNSNQSKAKVINLFYRMN